MAVQPLGTIDLCAIRVATLTSAGAPSTGSTNGYAVTNVVKLQVGVELEKGADATQKNGCGTIVDTIKEADQIKRVSLALDANRLDPDLKKYLLGGTLVTSGGNTTGYISAGSSDTPPVVCFEAWSKAWNGSQQATPAVVSPNAAYWHWVFPLTRWAQGQFTLEPGKFGIDALTSDGFENANITSNGPFDDWPAEIVAAGGVTKFYGVWLDDDLPTAGVKNVVSAAS